MGAARGSAVPAVGGSPVPRPASPSPTSSERAGAPPVGRVPGAIASRGAADPPPDAARAAGATGAMVPPRARKSTPAGGLGPASLDAERGGARAEAVAAAPGAEAGTAAPREVPAVVEAVEPARAEAPTDPGVPPAVDGDPEDLLATWDDVTPTVGATFAVPTAPESAPGPGEEERDAALEALLEPSGAAAPERRAPSPASPAVRGESADREREPRGTAAGSGFDLASAMAARPVGAERVGARSTPPAALAEAAAPRERPPPVAAMPMASAGPVGSSPGRPPDSHRSQAPAHAVPRAQGIVEEEASVVIAVDAASPSAPTAPTVVAEDELLPVAASPWWWEHRLVVGLGSLAIVALLIAAARVTLFAPVPVAVDVLAPGPSAPPARDGHGDERVATATKTDAVAAAEEGTDAAEPSASSHADAAASADTSGAPEASQKSPPRRRPRRPAAAAPPAATAPAGNAPTGDPAAPGATGASTPPPAAAPPSEPAPGGRASPIERDSPF